MYCVCVFFVYGFFFFKQKTAYEVRISDWSSDVCSSDLEILRDIGPAFGRNRMSMIGVMVCGHGSRDDEAVREFAAVAAGIAERLPQYPVSKIGRASCRERVCQYV